MKKVININFQGRVIPIEESAYDVLKQYIESLRSYFANEEGRDEIINDIEGRIAELFGEVLKKGSTCITGDDVEAIIKSMGRPEDFDDDEAKVQNQLGSQKTEQKTASSPSASSSANAGPQQNYAGTRHGRFYRDENNKVIAGVCSGIANYFGIDPLVVRILFVIFAFGFGFGFITYLVLWVAVPSTASTVIGSTKKRLFRDPDGKFIAGVCTGLSNYFGVNVWIPRVLFVIPFVSFVFRWSHWGSVDFPNFLSLTFSPGTLVIYIILWLVLPEATTTSEKLEMKGERVDLNSIKNTIQNDMEGFKDRAQQFGKEVGEKAQQFGKEFGSRSRQFSTEASTVARRGGSGVGSALGMIVKIFVYMIVGIILFSVVAGLFGSGVLLSSLLWVKSFVVSDGWQDLFAWGVLILFVWVPVIGIITWIIRRLAKMNRNSRAIRFTFVSLWLLGVFCLIGFITTMIDSFSYRYHSDEQGVQIPNPNVSKLEVRGLWYTQMDDDDDWFQIRPFWRMNGDTAYVRNTRIRITNSPNDSFTVTIKKYARGATRDRAEQLAEKIIFTVKQRDSILWVNDAVAFTRQDKFRDQMIDIIIGVPKNKKIQIDGSAKGWGADEHFGNDGYYNDEYDDVHHFYDFERDVEYIMTDNGLKRMYPRINRDDNNDNNDDDNNNQAKPNVQDTNVYHYQPSEKPERKEKPEKKEKPENSNPHKRDSIPAKQASLIIKPSPAMPSTLITRFTI